MPIEPGVNTPKEWMRAVLWLLWRIALYTLLIAGGVYVLFRIKAVIVTIFLGATLAYIMRPMAGWMARTATFTFIHDVLASPFRRLDSSRRVRATHSGGHLPMHVRRVIATLYVLVLLFVGGWYTTKIMVNPFVQEIKSAADNWQTNRDRLRGYLDQANALYVQRVPPQWRTWLEKQLKANQDSADMQRPLTAWVTESVRRVGELAHNIIEVVLLPVLAFYFAVDSKKIKHEFVGVLPRTRRREVLRMVHEFNRIMYSFVVGQAILCLIAGIVVGVGLALLGMRYPLMLGLLAGFTRAIPIIGPIIGGIPIVGLALVTSGVPTALGVLAFFTFLHFAESKFVMPMLIGERMRLHPVVIIVVLLIGQEFGGLLGMFFAAPVAALVRVIVRRYWLKSHLNGRTGSPPPSNGMGSGSVAPHSRLEEAAR